MERLTLTSPGVANGALHYFPPQGTVTQLVFYHFIDLVVCNSCVYLKCVCPYIHTYVYINMCLHVFIFGKYTNNTE